MVIAGSGKHLVCNPNVTSQRLGDDLVVVNLESDTIYTLNATAADVWEMLQSGSDMADIRDRLLADYDVEGARIDRELSEAVMKLRDIGLLVQASSPA